MKFEVFCEHQDYAMRLNFYIFRLNVDGSRDICTSLDRMEFARQEEGAIVEPTFSMAGGITKPFLQAMADTLHREGIYAEGEPILGNELIATKYHLEDMRTLVFASSDNQFLDLDAKTESSGD